MPTAQAFERIVNPDLWTDIAAFGGGYLGASLAQTTLEGTMPFDVPNEAYGLAVAYVGFSVDAKFSSKVATGGALYTLDSVAQRLGVKSAVTEMM